MPRALCRSNLQTGHALQPSEEQASESPSRLRWTLEEVAIREQLAAAARQQPPGVSAAMEICPQAAMRECPVAASLLTECVGSA